jgi:hypothetical protein
MKGVNMETLTHNVYCEYDIEIKGKLVSDSMRTTYTSNVAIVEGEYKADELSKVNFLMNQVREDIRNNHDSPGANVNIKFIRIEEVGLV